MHKFFALFLLAFSFAFSKEMIEDYLKPHNPKEDTSFKNNSLIENVYVVNLDKAEKRWTYMQGLLSEHGIFAERFSAVHGWALPRNSLKLFYKNCLFPWKNKFCINPGQIGVLLSHLSILKDALERKFQFIWILEDDVCFTSSPLPALDRYIQKLETIDPDWEVLFTDTNARNQNADGSVTVFTFRNNFGSCFDYSLIEEENFAPYQDAHLKKIEHRLGTYSMVFSRKGMENFYNYYMQNKMKFAYDVDYNLRKNKHMYQTTYDLVTTYGVFGSSTAFNQGY